MKRLRSPWWDLPFRRSERFLSRGLAVLVAVIVSTAGLLTTAPTSVQAATFTVTNVADAGEGSLREAIILANGSAGADTIGFAIAGSGPHTIAPSTLLPDITGPVTLDATAEALGGGAPGIVIDGTGAGVGHGLTLTAGADDSEIRGLRIVKFSASGIVLNGPTGVTIEGNYIGTDGTADLGNAQNGIVLLGATGNEIRGNVISGNGPAVGGACCSSGFGITLADSGASGNTIAGNLIGTNAAGTAEIGNGAYGINVSSPSNQIGGTNAADRNLISGNSRGVQYGGSATEGNVFEGNYVGTNAAGTSAITGVVHGIVLNQTNDAITIGGTAAGAGNVIAANATGILIANSSNALVQGNKVGVGADGVTALGNIAVGIQISTDIEFAANNNTIGGTVAGAGNLIANNGVGVMMNGTGGVGNRFIGNVIRDNTGLGIDIGNSGVTPNDAGDADTGPNRLQNFPLITGTGPSDIFGTLDSALGTYRIEIFSNVACDASGNGEGATLIDVATGVAPGSFGVDELPVNGTYLTATATNEVTGETSEFGPCHLVTNGLPEPGSWAGDAPPETAGTFLAAGDGATGPAQFTYDVLDANPDAGDGESGEWTFYTTAGSDGTFNVPWRYTGFHAFFQVRVGLEAFVIRDGDDVISNESLVSAGPADCCTTPSAGFDYSGAVTFDVEAGDIYGFTLSGSNGDSNETLRGELLLGNDVPTSCADARDLYDSTTDGRYVILPIDGQRFSVHCEDMSGSPKDYLTLELTGPGINTGSYAAGGLAVGTTVTTTFTKLRLNPATLTVDIGDLAFSTSGGSLNHPDGDLGNPLVTSMPYATAMACNFGPDNNGVANVDLRGTPFAVDDTWTPVGTSSASFGGATFSLSDQVVNIQGNGNCGWRTPYPEGPFYVFNPSSGQFGLTLRYLNEPPEADLATPVLFASVSTTATTADVFGIVEGAENSTLGFEVFRGSSCTDGVLSSPVAVPGPISATTDGAGYFRIQNLPSLATGTYVTVRVTSPSSTDTSTCVRTSADNYYWPKALTMSGSTQDVIDTQGMARWYRFDVAPGQRIEIKLSDLPADYDLAVFKDIGKTFLDLLDPEDTADLTELSAEYAPSVFSPSVFSPSVFSPSVFSPDAYSPSVFSPSVFSPSVFSPSVFSPSVFSPSVFSPSVFSPSVFSPSVFSPSVFSPSVFSPSVFSPSVFSEDEIGQAFSSAQTRSIIGVSATPGAGDETVVVNSWNNSGEFYVRVAGHSGAFDTGTPFTLNVVKGPTSCGSVVDPVPFDRTVQANTNRQTVILTDSSRLALGGAGATTLNTKLTALAARTEVAGVRVDVALDTRVQALRTQAANNPACPYAMNLVAEEIKAIVDSYRANPLRYVVVVGGDGVIPFFRYPDQSLLGQESGYVPPVRSDSTSEASLRKDFVLSQDAYGAGTQISLRASEFPVPGLAVGRLVETPAEISGQLDEYGRVSGQLTPTTSLVTGYDFLEDAANAVRAELAAGTGATPATLITPNGKSPQDPASWTATQLATQLLGSRHDVNFLAGHFSANSALAADFQTSLLTTDLAASPVDLRSAIVFSAGCHSGYNLVDGDAITGVTLPLDWAQAFAQKRSILIAGTGYQYGDTDFLEYSERLYRDFARELRAGLAGTRISVGEALVRAKHAYLATTPDIRGIHEKALLEATLFGLPMFGVVMPAGRGATPGTGTAITPTLVGTQPAASLGLAAADLNLNLSLPPGLTPQQLALKNPPYDALPGTFTIAKWLSGPNGVVTNPAEPALPLVARNVTSSDGSLVLRGVGFRGGTYTDTPGIVPLTGAPTTELRGVHAPFVSPVFYPMRLWTPNYFGALGGVGGTNLLVTPVQHKTDNPALGTSIQRAYTNLNMKLFYSGNLSAAALSDAPTIVDTQAVTGPGGVTFTAQVVGDPKAAVHGVWITYTGGTGTWTSLDLAQCIAPLPAGCSAEDSRLWTGTLLPPPASPANLQFVVQAVNGFGLVSFDDNRASYYTVGGGGALTGTTLTLVSPPTTGTFGDVRQVVADLKVGATGVGGKLVTIGIGGSTVAGTTNASGRVTLNVQLNSNPGPTQIVASFGGDTTHGPSGADAPFTIGKATSSLSPYPAFVTQTSTTSTGNVTTLSAQVGGKTQPLIQQTVTFTLTGPVNKTISSITDYLGRADLPKGLPTGTYTVVASFAGDATYTSATRTGTLLISTFNGFLWPVANPPKVNVAKANFVVPLRFGLGGNLGLGILATGSPTATKITCATGAPTNEVDQAGTFPSLPLTYIPLIKQYLYVWKVPKAYAGSCYQLTLTLIDGSSYSALFKFK